jgi:hypothetical protein
MRFGSAPLILTGGVWLAACAPASGPAASPASSASVTVVAKGAPAATPPATQAAASAPTAPPATGQGGCFAKPVTLGGKKLQPQPVAEATLNKLPGCDGQTDIDECRFSVARAYFQANRFEDAGPIYKDLAFSSRDDIAPYAAQLYLECLNVLGSQAEPPRPVCFDEMTDAIAPMQARHCSKGSKDAQELCTLLRRIERDIQRMRAEQLIKDADKGGPDSLLFYREAGDTYMALFNQHCAFRRPGPGRKPEPPPGWTGDARCDEIAYNAMRAYMAAREPALAESARAALMNPDNGLTKSELTKRAAALQIQ